MFALALALAAAPTNLRDLKSDLTVPAAVAGEPAAGKRVFQVNPGFEKTELRHTLYLPADWKAGRKYPVIVEYPGNGGYSNDHGDRCTGLPENCNLGYGLSGGTGCIWVCLPFVSEPPRKPALTWWGESDATVDYCKKTVARIVKEYGGDPDAVILAGFSRGAIACNYIGLRDDDIAKLWRGFFIHSHYDGVRKWPYSDSDAASAKERLKRLNGRPQFISHELRVDETKKYLADVKGGDFTFVPIPYVNHTDEWLLKDIPERKLARDWLVKVLAKQKK
jgi:hypothetical protein